MKRFVVKPHFYGSAKSPRFGVYDLIGKGWVYNARQFKEQLSAVNKCKLLNDQMPGYSFKISSTPYGRDDFRDFRIGE